MLLLDKSANSIFTFNHLIKTKKVFLAFMWKNNYGYPHACTLSLVSSCFQQIQATIAFNGFCSSSRLSWVSSDNNNSCEMRKCCCSRSKSWMERKRTLLPFFAVSSPYYIQYTYLQKHWNWNPDTKFKLSKDPEKS